MNNVDLGRQKIGGLGSVGDLDGSVVKIDMDGAMREIGRNLGCPGSDNNVAGWLSNSTAGRLGGWGRVFGFNDDVV